MAESDQILEPPEAEKPEAESSTNDSRFYANMRICVLAEMSSFVFFFDGCENQKAVLHSERFRTRGPNPVLSISGLLDYCFTA